MFSQEQTHLLAGQSSARRGQRDGLDAKPGPVGVEELRLPLDLLPVGHEQRLEAETTGRALRESGCALTDPTHENEIQLAHLDLLHFFQPLQLTQPHVLRLDAPSPHEQAVRGRRGRRRRLWGRRDRASAAAAAGGRSCRGGWLHDSFGTQTQQARQVRYTCWRNDTTQQYI